MEILRSTDATFCEIYRRYYSDYEPLEAFLFHAQEELHGIALQGKEVLEVGCGRGAFSLYVALQCNAGKVIAIDEAEGHGAHAQHLKTFHEIIERNAITNLEARKGDITKNPLHDRAFDCIVANFSLHHVLRSGGYIFKNEQCRGELLHALKSLHGYLNNNGRIVLREMSRVNFWRFMPYKWKMSHIDWDIHPALQEWLWALKEAGFKNISYAFLTPYFLRKWPPALIRTRFLNFFFSSSFYLYGEKQGTK